MSRWKVNKERINNDIPSANGNIPDGGFVTYPTKRLIVDAMKMVGNKKIESYNYIKENVTPNQKEERDGVNIDNPKSEIMTGLPIANYRGIDMRHALSSKTNGKFNQYFVPVDDEFNVGLPIKGYNVPSGNYEVPHINFGINDFWIRKSNGAYSKDNISEENEDYYISHNENDDNVKNKHISYGCYPLMDRYEKYTIKGTIESAPVDHAPNFVNLDLSGNYTVMSFIIEESANYKLASWHFHTSSSVYLSNNSLSSTVYNYKLERSEDSLSYTLINRSNSAGLAVHTLFFEYENEITYNDEKETTQKTQLNWGSEQSNNPIILVRRLMRDKNGNILKGDNDEPQWKLCIHAKTNTKYTLKTWNIMKNEFDSINSFYKDTILKGVVSYDETEFTNFLEAGGYVGDKFVKSGLYVDIRLYAEECIEGGTGGGTDNKSFDVPEYTLHTKDVHKTKEYRYYDILNREEWKKTKSEDKSCVDDTTCKLFREYTQQILPSTAIVKAPRCQINEENTYVKDEKISDLAPENINYTEWEEEVLENSSDEFVKAVFDVYFDSLEGTNIEKKTYTITNKDDYDKYINGTLGVNLITSYPKVDGNNVEYWYMSANKSIVEDGVELPDLYKFGGSSYQKVDFYKHSGIHFYPNLYQKVTLTINFHEPKNDSQIITTKTYTLANKSEYEQFLNNNLTVEFDTTGIPTTWNGDGYHNAPIGFWVIDKFWNTNDKRVIQDDLTDNDKLGSETAPITNIFNKYIFGDKTEIDVYPLLGAVDVNYIVIKYTMSTTQDMKDLGIWGGDVGQLYYDHEPIDLDTETYIANEGAKISTYSFGYYTDSYLGMANQKEYGPKGRISDDCFIWSGDNVGAGEENCMIFVKEYEHGDSNIGMFEGKLSLTNDSHPKFTSYNDFDIIARGYWHGVLNDTKGYPGALAKLTISLYKGGRTKPNGYNYVVEPLDGEDNLIQEFTTPWRPLKTKHGDYTKSELMGIIHYNRITKTVEVVEPFVVRGEEKDSDPYKLTTYEGYYDTSLYDIYLNETEANKAAEIRQTNVIKGNRLGKTPTEIGERIYAVLKK